MRTQRPQNEPRTTWSARSVVFLGVVIAAVAAMTVGAHASEHTFNRGLAAACTQYAQQLDRFPDVAADATHAAAIDCLSHWEIVMGREGPDGEFLYAPGDDVSRAAMASYVVGTLARLPEVEVPDPADDRFTDYGTGVHADNVHVLRAAGIVQGRSDGTYAPFEPVTRGQMASYIAETIAFVTGEQITAGDGFSPAFPDTDGAVHAANIDRLATIGVVTGRADGTYGPAEPVSRAAMASYVARSMDYLAFRGYLPVPFQIDMEVADDPAPSNLNQRVTGLLEDQYAMGYFSAEVRFEVVRDGALVLTAHRTSGLGGDLEFRYNAGAEEGDSDRVAACVVPADAQPQQDVPFCLEGENLDPVEDRRATDLSFDWGAPATSSPAPDEGEFFGMALDIDPAQGVLWYQTLPTPDAPVDVPLGEYLTFDYVEEANFQVAEETNVAVEVFECAIELSIADERNPHLLNISLGPDRWNTYALSTGTDVRDCW